MYKNIFSYSFFFFFLTNTTILIFLFDFPPLPHFPTELTLTIILLTRDTLTILTSSKKAAAFEADCKSVFGADVAGGKLELQVIVKNKADEYKANYAALIATATAGLAAGTTLKLGTFTKITSQGAFTTGWDAAVKKETNIELVDISSGFAVASAVKDEKELLSCKNASRLSAKVMKLLKEEITSTIDAGNASTHTSLVRLKYVF
jgi:nucleosome binding factor SPN SPT16 subunit